MAAEPASAQRTLLVFAGMVVSIALAWTIRDRVLNGPAVQDGPLRPYLVEPADPPACSGAACAITLVAPLPGQVSRVQPVGYQAAPPEVIAAQPGQALVPLSPALLYTSGSTAGKLPFASQRWPRMAGDEPSLQPLAVHSAGYLLSGKDLRSGEVVVFDGQHLGTADAQRVYSELSFQPMPTHLAVSTAQVWQPAPNPGEVMLLHFVPPGQGTNPADAPIEVRLQQADPSTVPPTMLLYLDRGLAYSVLEQRFGPAGTESRVPLPKQMWLEWRDRGNTMATNQWRVPASAVQRDGEGARLWVSVEGWAVPVAVTELQKAADYSVVSERPGARGLAVRVADWRAMSSGARRAAFRAAAGQTMHLLQPAAKVISEPPADLVPGASVPKS